MDLLAIFSPVIAIGGMGLLFGIGLGFTAKKFAVPVDERVEAIKECLPGANCGGCGLAGCEAMAKSIVAGESNINACPVCNESQVEAMAKVMGIVANACEKQIAVVGCKGNDEQAKLKYIYSGISNCMDAHLIGGGPKVCAYGCLGFGSCQKVCAFDAITMEQGLPVIHPEKCVGCGACKNTCPRHVIQILPVSATYHVNCISKDRGPDVKKGCIVGCIGCGICVKQCEEKAIILENNCAKIDVSKCVSCGKCETKCPVNAISNLHEERLKQKTLPIVPLDSGTVHINE